MLDLLVAPIAGLLDKFIPDADERNRLAHEISTMAERHAHEMAKAQVEVNKTEAAHKSLFVSGWRPATGWCCSLGLGFNFLVVPLGNVILGIAQYPVHLEPLDLSQMMPVLLGMLGLGGLRTVEKIKNVQRDQ